MLASLLAAAAPLAALAQSPGAPPPPPEPAAPEAEPPLPDADVNAPLPPEPPPPSDALAPAQPPSPQTFERALSPYGAFVVTPRWGRVWKPSVPPGWQPYTDGRWVFTDAGWSFAADVPWGWAAFHYGRWGYSDELGWFWVPGYVWAPAWVSWRTSPTYVAWAPLAPAGFVYPRGWSGWIALRAGEMTLVVRTHAVPRASVAVVLRGARPGWAYAPARLRPEYRLRVRRAAPARRIERREERRERRRDRD
jgi:hypothetical protein